MVTTDRSTFPVALVAVVGDVDADRARATLSTVLSALNEQLAAQGVPVRLVPPDRSSAGVDEPSADLTHVYDLRRDRRLCEIDDDQARAAQLDLAGAGVDQLGCAECLSRLVLREEATLTLLQERIAEVAS